jgi:hypothetical protein
MRPESHFCGMEAAALPKNPGQIARSRHLTGMATGTGTVQPRLCGGTQGMEPMHHPARPDSKGMEHPEGLR